MNQRASGSESGLLSGALEWPSINTAGHSLLAMPSLRSGIQIQLMLRMNVGLNEGNFNIMSDSLVVNYPILKLLLKINWSFKTNNEPRTDHLAIHFQMSELTIKTNLTGHSYPLKVTPNRNFPIKLDFLAEMFRYFQSQTCFSDWLKQQFFTETKLLVVI